jgi:hypothetical protein
MSLKITFNHEKTFQQEKIVVGRETDAILDYPYTNIRERKQEGIPHTLFGYGDCGVRKKQHEQLNVFRKI